MKKSKKQSKQLLRLLVLNEYINMIEKHKSDLNKQLWNIADALRGNMSADEFHDYILGFIFFYKYMSEKMLQYANEILSEDGIRYEDIKEKSKHNKEYLKAIKTKPVRTL